MAKLIDQVYKPTDNANERKHMEKHYIYYEDRKRFYIKVLILFFFQLCLMTFVLFIFHYIVSIKEWIRKHMWSIYFLSLLNGYSVIILLKVATIERFFPFNVMTLGVFTLFHSIIVAQITSEIAAFTEGLSFFFVLLTSTILFVFATRYSHDITNSFSQYFCLFTMPLAFIPIFIVIFAVEGFESILTKVFMGFTTIYFLLFTSITAQILQGSRFVEVDTQDYVLGSMQLFTEILCASLAMSTLLDGSSSEEYYWFTTIFLTFNIHLLYFFILVNAVELKSKLKRKVSQILEFSINS
ncbi:unnamed protein product [Heterobilharzia americana]|nr:unnamed protein product [Heterobilharzia americana]